MNRRVEVSDYLLGELSPEDRLEAERLIREDPDFRTEVERLEAGGCATLRAPGRRLGDAGAAPLRISPESLGAAAAPAPATETDSRPEARKRSGSGFGSHRWRLTLRPAMAGLCAAALVAIGVGAGFALDSGSGGSRSLGAVRLPSAPSARWTLAPPEPQPSPPARPSIRATPSSPGPASSCAACAPVLPGRTTNSG